MNVHYGTEKHSRSSNKEKTTTVEKGSVTYCFLVLFMACLAMSSCLYRTKLTNQDFDTSYLLYTACRSGQTGDVKKALHLGANPDGDENPDKPLLAAARNGHTQIVRLLAQEGANLNARDQFGNSPLHIACWKGHLHLAQFLVEDGLNPNSKNSSMETPLMFCAMFCHPSILSFLLQQGASPTEKDQEGLTALHWAALGGCTHGVDLLLSASGQILNEQDSLGRTPLMLAVLSGNQQTISTLIRRGALTSLTDGDGHTVFDYAEENGDKAVVALLRGRGMKTK